MPGANSVTSNQETIHKDLEEVVRKYARTTFLRPIADHTREAFAEVEEFVKKFYDARNNGQPQQEQNEKLWIPSLRSRMTASRTAWRDRDTPKMTVQKIPRAGRREAFNFKRMA